MIYRPTREERMELISAVLERLRNHEPYISLIMSFFMASEMKIIELNDIRDNISEYQWNLKVV